MSGAASADSVTVNTEKLNLRKEADASSKALTVVRKGEALSFVSESDDWYQVKVDGKTGFVMKGYVVLDRKQLEADIEENTVRYASAKSARTTARINMRQLPMTTADIEKVLSNGASIEVLGECGEWYLVKYGSRTGYLMAEYVSMNEKDETVIVPSQPESSAPSSETLYSEARSGKTAERVNLRKTASASAKVVKVLDKNQSLSVLGENGDWYKVSARGYEGYIAKSYVVIGSDNGSSGNTGDIVPDGLVSYPAARSGVITERVNLREEASTSCDVVKVLAKNTSVTVMGEMGSFYQVKAGSSFGFVAKNYVSLGSASQPEEKPEEKPEESKPEDSSAQDTLYSAERTGTATVKVNMRREPEGEVLFTLPEGTYITLIGERGNWYKVKYNNSTGYVSKSYVTEGAASAPSQPEKNETVTPSQPAETKGTTGYVSTGTVNMRKGPGTNYGVIKVLSKGDELTFFEETDGWYRIKQGSDSGYLSAKYVTTTKPAVSTPSQPSGSAPIEKPNSGSVQMADWWTSNIQKTFARGVIATVTDVDTGISWQVIRSGGSNHADVQPLTPADTAKMKQAYGGKWSWNRRAIWVTINGVTYAASMNGMPHGSGSITTNNFDGHHCIHFLNSRTHTENRWDTQHQAMVQKAYKAGQ